MKKISKSLFKEFCQSPKLARWHENDRDVYKNINNSLYGSMDAVAIWQEVEDVTAEMLSARWKIVSVNAYRIDQRSWYQSYDTKTMEALKDKPDILYQPGFLHNDLFVKSDFLVKNESGTYDLYEVKSKTRIRKKNKTTDVIDDLLCDVSFQKYVLEQKLWLLFSGNCFVVHLNGDYIHQGNINVEELLIVDDVTDECFWPEQIELTLTTIRESMPLNEEEFNQRFPYQWENYMIYFGQKAPNDSIYSIPRITQTKKKLVQLHEAGKTKIDDLTKEDIDLLSNSKPDSSFAQYIHKYRMWKTIQKEIIKEKLHSLQFPLYFYDYETVSCPVPHFQWSTPWQHIIAQYSLHKLEKDWSITHSEWIIKHNQSDNRGLIDKLIEDLRQTDKWTYIVRYKGFENVRNNETGTMYPEYKNDFEFINENTFDLMDIFKDKHYFDPAFEWSCSIKKVLPVLTDISYKDLEVGNGAIASELLTKLAKWKIDKEKVQATITNLLEYCKLDTRAMVAIYQKLLKAIEK